MVKILYTTKDVSELLNVSEETVRRWIRSGDLEAKFDGKSYFIEEEVLNRYLKEKGKGSAAKFSKIGAAAAMAAVNPLLGATFGLASLAKKKFQDTKEENGSSSEQAFDVKDIDDYIQALQRKKKKLELEHQLKLLEIEDEIEAYMTIKKNMEREK